MPKLAWTACGQVQRNALRLKLQCSCVAAFTILQFTTTTLQGRYSLLVTYSSWAATGVAGHLGSHLKTHSVEKSNKTASVIMRRIGQVIWFYICKRTVAKSWTIVTTLQGRYSRLVTSSRCYQTIPRLMCKETGLSQFFIWLMAKELLLTRFKWIAMQRTVFLYAPFPSNHYYESFWPHGCFLGIHMRWKIPCEQNARCWQVVNDNIEGSLLMKSAPHAGKFALMSNNRKELLRSLHIS